MGSVFPIITVPPDAPEYDEPIRTKEEEAFWFHEQNLGLCLYKEARLNTGEDWAEKIASELCTFLRLPHAEYDLATYNGKRGTISRSFVPEGGTSIVGIEVLARLVPDYPTNARDLSRHTIDIVFNALNDSSVQLPMDWTPPEGIKTAVDVFVGYLLLDAWVGNSDRHHQNWGLIQYKGLSAKVQTTYLAPTYDHGSCLGRELPDEKRLLKLNNGSVEGYVTKCPSYFYAKVEGDKRKLKTFEVFREVAGRYPDAASVWLEYLAKVSLSDTLDLFRRIPSDRISETAIKFAQKVLELNQNRLLDLRNIQ
ncbi:HipA-like protein [Planktothrix sp. FACHB-1355]|uniref:HipA-like protein n=1 Tax=Aerosakkonema funiforme FACHB-1375 TaxID=2949571 RepID=A0A926VB62_9CYAN|nr:MULTISPECIES: HipA-like protein [Oscillatoriales]MBD2180460.1 HipA-like protein [Aerosakkonema funiforme FACHB-1375]MBD3560281.1 HipA-like protein [Planktothrix sp. FACHB-1355]